MNYIGSKCTLLPFISQTINSYVDGGVVHNFADIFAGTGVVGSYFKQLGADVIANDMQYYSYVINKFQIEFDNSSIFENFIDVAPTNELFDDISLRVQSYFDSLVGYQGFVYANYSSGGTQDGEFNRMYFTDENAKKCDAIRVEIENLRQNKRINKSEYYYLLSSLLYSIDRVANTASVYGAFLKQYKASAKKTLIFKLAKLIQGKKRGIVYNRDANELIKDIEGQVLYLDPPYNHRQYAANYHLLETIARYDNPSIKGVSGIRDYSEQKSSYCMKSRASESFEELIANARFDYVFLSYNNEGIIPIEHIEKTMRKFGKYCRVEKSYQRYKADSNRLYKDDKTVEYLHILKRN